MPKAVNSGQVIYGGATVILRHAQTFNRFRFLKVRVGASVVLVTLSFVNFVFVIFMRVIPCFSIELSGKFSIFFVHVHSARGRVFYMYVIILTLFRW